MHCRNRKSMQVCRWLGARSTTEVRERDIIANMYVKMRGRVRPCRGLTSPAPLVAHVACVGRSSRLLTLRVHTGTRARFAWAHRKLLWLFFVRESPLLPRRPREIKEWRHGRVCQANHGSARGGSFGLGCLPASCGVVLPFVFLAKRALSSRWRCIRLLTYVPPYRTLSS